MTKVIEVNFNKRERKDERQEKAIKTLFGYHNGSDIAVLTYPDGTVYEGEFKNGKQHGNGTMTFLDGDIYEGEFKDDKWYGKGKLIYSDGVVKGEWKDDKIQNINEITLSNGDVYKGQRLYIQIIICKLLRFLRTLKVTK
tara:strand:- start:3275 stop:3694 length:420 start_codon:yes stop_codon:yes gene_type:complete